MVENGLRKASEVMAHDRDAGTAREVAVLFADLAGYTALTEAHGDQEAARAALRLLELTRDAYDGEATLVKSMGDGVMVVFDDVDRAMSAALALSHAAEAEDRFLGLRVGLHTGPAVVRHGDVFGATVNLAARLAEHAQPSQVLVTSAVRDRLRRTPDLGWVELGTASLRHVREPVQLLTVRTRKRRDATTDPVCRMVVTDQTTGATEERYRDRRIRFCSEACARLFRNRPDAYL